MKSLRESLFDSDLVTKDLTFGDLFEFVPIGNADELISVAQKSHMWEKYLSSVRIRKDAKVKYKTPDENIYYGLLKLIKDIKFDSSNLTTDSFKDYLNKMMHPYYQYTLSDNYKHAGMGVYKNDTICISKEFNMFESEFNTLIIYPCQTLAFKFKRK